MQSHTYYDHIKSLHITICQLHGRLHKHCQLDNYRSQQQSIVDWEYLNQTCDTMYRMWMLILALESFNLLQLGYIKQLQELDSHQQLQTQHHQIQHHQIVKGMAQKLKSIGSLIHGQQNHMPFGRLLYRYGTSSLSHLSNFTHSLRQPESIQHWLLQYKLDTEEYIKFLSTHLLDRLRSDVWQIETDIHNLEHTKVPPTKSILYPSLRCPRPSDFSLSFNGSGGATNPNSPLGSSHFKGTLERLDKGVKQEDLISENSK